MAGWKPAPLTAKMAVPRDDPIDELGAAFDNPALTVAGAGDNPTAGQPRRGRESIAASMFHMDAVNRN